MHGVLLRVWRGHIADWRPSATQSSSAASRRGDDRKLAVSRRSETTEDFDNPALIIRWGDSYYSADAISLTSCRASSSERSRLDPILSRLRAPTYARGRYG